jgi:hypothetical protein
MAWSMKEVLFSSGMGDIFQQGGDFVFSPEGEIVFQVNGYSLYCFQI